MANLHPAARQIYKKTFKEYQKCCNETILKEMNEN